MELSPTQMKKTHGVFIINDIRCLKPHWNHFRNADGQTDACSVNTWARIREEDVTQIGAGIVTLNLHIFLFDYDIWWKMGYSSKEHKSLFMSTSMCTILYNFMPRDYYYPLYFILIQCLLYIRHYYVTCIHSFKFHSNLIGSY